MTVPVLAISDLAVSVGGRPLLAGVSVTLGAGEAAAVLGPSGIGKSALLRAVAGLGGDAGGEVRLVGRTGAELGWPALRRRLVWVPREPGLGEGSVEDVLRRPFAYRSAGGASFDADAAEASLAEMDLPTDVMGREARSLSSGERQRVALVRALLVGPDALLLDEPFSGLDPERTRAAAERLSTWLAGGGRALLLAAHHPAALAGLDAKHVDLARYRIDRAAPAGASS